MHSTSFFFGFAIVINIALCTCAVNIPQATWSLLYSGPRRANATFISPNVWPPASKGALKWELNQGVLFCGSDDAQLTNATGACWWWNYGTSAFTYYNPTAFSSLMRRYSSTWVDKTTNTVFIYGGLDGTGAAVTQYKIWKATVTFNINTITLSAWSALNAADSTSPGSKIDAVTWSTSSGDFFLFGGRSSTSVQDCNWDMWRFRLLDSTTFQWYSVIAGGSSGDYTSLRTTVYGSSGAENSTIHPPGLCAPASLVVGNAVYVWGGGYPATAPSKQSWNNLWRFNMTTQMWAFLSGSLAPNAVSFWFQAGYSTSEYMPGGAFGANMFYNSLREVIFVWGGESTAGLRSELWAYYLRRNEWALVGGENLNGPVGFDYPPVTGGSDPRIDFNPGAARRPSFWQLSDGTVYLQGGYHRMNDEGTYPHVWSLVVYFPVVSDPTDLNPAPYTADFGAEVAVGNFITEVDQWVYGGWNWYAYDRSSAIAQRELGLAAPYPGGLVDGFSFGFRGFVWNFSPNPVSVVYHIRADDEISFACGTSPLPAPIVSPVMIPESGGANVTWTMYSPKEPIDWTWSCVLDPGPNRFAVLGNDDGGDYSLFLWISDADGFTNKRLLHRSYVTATPYDPKPTGLDDTIPMTLMKGFTARLFYNRTDFSGQPEVYRVDRSISQVYSTVKTNPFTSGFGWRTPHSASWDGWILSSSAAILRFDLTCNDAVSLVINGSVIVNVTGANSVSSITAYSAPLAAGWSLIKVIYAEYQPVAGGGCQVKVRDNSTLVEVPVWTRPEIAPIGPKGSWSLVHRGGLRESARIDTSTVPTTIWPPSSLGSVTWELSHGSFACGTTDSAITLAPTSCWYFNSTLSTYTWYNSTGWYFNRRNVLAWTDKTRSWVWFYGGQSSTNAMISDNNLYRAVINPLNNSFNLTWTAIPPAGSPFLGQRTKSTTWVDGSGNLWLFGGTTVNVHNCNRDLWMFNITTNIWTTVNAGAVPVTINNMRVFSAGPRGVESNTYFPPGTCSAAVRVVGSLVYMYGGAIPTAFSIEDSWNDLWRFNLSSQRWAFMSGSLQVLSKPFWIKQGYFAPNYTPGQAFRGFLAYQSSTNWLWLWGGFSPTGARSELWAYSLSLDQWAVSPGPVGHEAFLQYPPFNAQSPAHPGSFSEPSIFQTSDEKVWVQGGYHPFREEGSWAHVWSLSLLDDAAPLGNLTSDTLNPLPHRSGAGGAVLTVYDGIVSLVDSSDPYATVASMGVVAYSETGSWGYPGINNDSFTYSFHGFIWNESPEPQNVLLIGRGDDNTWLAVGDDLFSNVLQPVWRTADTFGTNATFFPDSGHFAIDFPALVTLLPGATEFVFQVAETGGSSSATMYIADADGTNKRLMHDSFVTRTPYDAPPTPATNSITLGDFQVGLVASYYWNRTDFSGSRELYRIDPAISLDLSLPRLNPFNSKGWRANQTSVSWNGWLYAGSTSADVQFNVTCDDRISLSVNGSTIHDVSPPRQLQSATPTVNLVGWIQIQVLYADFGNGGGCFIKASNVANQAYLPFYTQPFNFPPVAAPFAPPTTPPITPPTTPPLSPPQASPQSAPQTPPTTSPVNAPAAEPKSGVQPESSPTAGPVSAPAASPSQSSVTPSAAPLEAPTSMFPPNDLSAPNGLLGDYYVGAFVSGSPVLRRVDAAVSFSWAANSYPTGSQQFAIRWSGYLDFKSLLGQSSERNVNFALQHTGGVRLFVNNAVVVDAWSNSRKRTSLTSSGTVALNADSANSIQIEFRSGADPTQSIQFLWSSGSAAFQPVPTSAISPNPQASAPSFSASQSDTKGPVIGGSIGAALAIIIVVIVVLVIMKKKGLAFFAKGKKKDPKKTVWDEENPANKPAEMSVYSSTSFTKDQQQVEDSDDDKDLPPPAYDDDLADFKEEWMIPFADVTIGKKLGQGAFGVVYKGEWGGEPVAIKQCTLNVGPAGVADFKAEAKLMLSIKPHPSIVQVFGLTVHQGSIYMILEYCGGGSLDSYMKKKQLTFEQKISILESISRGVDHLHRNGIIHRDLACRNILVNSAGKAKVADFGMSRIVDKFEQKGTTQSTMGPVKWMSPESLRDRQYGSPSDTWTFGIVCYELWAEKEPHDSEDLLSIGIKIRDMGITPKLPQDMPEWLQKICYQCWAYEPQQRPRMSAVAKAIRQGGSEARGESEES